MTKNILTIIAIVLSISSYGQVGINTVSPTSTLDINGDLRVRQTDLSSTNDATIVVDANGVVKKKLVDTKGIVRIQLIGTYTAGTSITTIYKPAGTNILKELDDPGNDYNPSTGIFIAPATGLYRLNLTAASSPTPGSGSMVAALVIGIAQTSDNKWVMRFTTPIDTIINGVGTGSSSGISNSYVGVVQLIQGQAYYLGISCYQSLLSTPTDSTTGPGAGTSFEIELIQNN